MDLSRPSLPGGRPRPIPPRRHRIAGVCWPAEAQGLTRPVGLLRTTVMTCRFGHGRLVLECLDRSGPEGLCYSAGGRGNYRLVVDLVAAPPPPPLPPADAAPCRRPPHAHRQSRLLGARVPQAIPSQPGDRRCRRGGAKRTDGDSVAAGHCRRRSGRHLSGSPAGRRWPAPWLTPRPCNPAASQELPFRQAHRRHRSRTWRRRSWRHQPERRL